MDQSFSSFPFCSIFGWHRFGVAPMTTDLPGASFNKLPQKGSTERQYCTIKMFSFRICILYIYIGGCSHIKSTEGEKGGIKPKDDKC